MVFAWIIALIVALVGTRASVKKEQAEASQEKINAVPQVESESEDEEDWEIFCKESQQAVDDEDRFYLKEKKLITSSSTTKHPTRSKNSRGRGIQINEPLARARSLPRESKNTPSASIQSPSTSKTITTKADILSMQRAQRRMSEAHERMSADIHKMKKNCSKLSKMLKGILHKLDCSSSEGSESDN